MEIAEYTPAYEDAVKDLLVELQSHLASIDPYRIIVLRDTYRDGYFAHALNAVQKHSGKIFLAMEDDAPVGVVIRAPSVPVRRSSANERIVISGTRISSGTKNS